MPTTKKVLIVQNLAEKFKQAKGVVLVDYSGLNVPKISELRNQVKKAGGEFEVVKNTLLCLAAENVQFAIPNSQLTNPTAALWIYQEDFSPLKALDNFIKANESPKIKFGFWQGEEITAERVKQIAQLPGITELQAELVGVFNSPISKLAAALNWNLRQLVYLISNSQPVIRN